MQLFLIAVSFLSPATCLLLNVKYQSEPPSKTNTTIMMGRVNATASAVTNTSSALDKVNASTIPSGLNGRWATSVNWNALNAGQWGALIGAWEAWWRPWFGTHKKKVRRRSRFFWSFRIPQKKNKEEDPHSRTAKKI